MCQIEIRFVTQDCEQIMKKNNPRVAIIIPARLGSSRFPNKPLTPICGISMVEMVYQNALATPSVQTVAVATCDIEIAELITRIGGTAVLTSAAHQRATDRTAEAVLYLEENLDAPFDIVVMLQGDEPMISSDQLAEVIQVMAQDPTIRVTNLVGRILSQDEFLDPNCIKVVSDLDGKALYFSRHPIPHGADHRHGSVGKQVCAIGFRRNYLLEYLALEATELEELESIDMLRVIEHGQNVHLIRTERTTQSVDVESDVTKVEELLSRKSFT